MGLTVLSVAYPFAPVGADSVGGAEQVLGHIDEALVCAGHCSIVIGCEGSTVAGKLLPVPRVSGMLDEGEIEAAHSRHRRAINAALEQWPIDVFFVDRRARDHEDDAVEGALLAGRGRDGHVGDGRGIERPRIYPHAIGHADRLRCKGPSGPRQSGVRGPERPPAERGAGARAGCRGQRGDGSWR